MVHPLRCIFSTSLGPLEPGISNERGGPLVIIGEPANLSEDNGTVLSSSIHRKSELVRLMLQQVLPCGGACLAQNYSWRTQNSRDCKLISLG